MTTSTRKLDPDRCKAAMERAGYKNVNQIRLRMGVFHKRVAEWRDAVRAPTAEHLIELARLLGVTPSFLYGEDLAQLALEAISIVRAVFGDDVAEVLDAAARRMRRDLFQP